MTFRHELSKKVRTIFINVALGVTSALRSTLASVCLGLAVGSATDLRSVGVIQNVKQEQSVELQERPHSLASLTP
jgi:hypothetical protein